LSETDCYKKLMGPLSLEATMLPLMSVSMNQEINTPLVSGMFFLDLRRQHWKRFEILDDINSVQLALGNECASTKIVAKIKNTMSDRHSAEKLFNQLLEEFRGDILPSITENWSNLTPIEKDQMICMNNFFCGLHFVVGLADTAEEVLKKWESQSLSTNIPGSSGTQRLVRTACKVFRHKGSQQSGCSTLFRSYLRNLNITKIPLAHFVGNRFNIIFYDAAGVFLSEGPHEMFH